MDMKQAECSSFFDAMQQAQAGMLRTLAEEDSAVEAALESAVLTASQCHAEIIADADRRLDAAAAAAERWLAESERAAKTLELLGVEVQDGELPHLTELPMVHRQLRLAWGERCSFGESQRHEEIEEMLQKLAAEDPNPPAALDGTASSEEPYSFFDPPRRARKSAAPSETVRADASSRRAPPHICVADALSAECSTPLVSPSCPETGKGQMLDSSTPLVSPSCSPSGGQGKPGGLPLAESNAL